MSTWRESLNTLRERWEAELSNEYAQKDAVDKINQYVKHKQGFLSEEGRFYLERINKQQDEIKKYLEQIILKQNELEKQYKDMKLAQEQTLEDLEHKIALGSYLPYTQEKQKEKYFNSYSIFDDLDETDTVGDSLNYIKTEMSPLAVDEYLHKEMRIARKRVDSFSQEQRHTF